MDEKESEKLTSQDRIDTHKNACNTREYRRVVVTFRLSWDEYIKLKRIAGANVSEYIRCLLFNKKEVKVKVKLLEKQVKRLAHKLIKQKKKSRGMNCSQIYNDGYRKHRINFEVYNLPIIDIEGKVRLKPKLKLCELGSCHFKPPDEIHLGSWIGGWMHDFEDMFTHEFLHYLLYHFISEEASIKLDNVAKFLNEVEIQK